MTRTTAIAAVGLAGVVLIVSSCLKGPQEPDGGWPSDLGVPTLVSPANGSTTTDQTPAFDWSDVSGATKYRIQVDNNSNFGSPEMNQEVPSSTYTPTSNLAYGTYYWRACAGNAAGWGSYATSWSFTIQTVPGVPTLVSPTNGSTTTDQTPAFDWSDVSGATKYRIQVDNNSNFGSPEIDQEVTASTYTPTSNLAYGTYYWRVCAGNAAGWGSYATSWSFTIVAQTTLLDMVPLSGGTFQMGSNYYGTGSDEYPPHPVTITAFAMAKYEVTQAEYEEVMGSNPSYFSGDNRPVEQVTWWNAAKFCNALSAREGLTKFYNDDDLNSAASTVRMTWSANGYRLPTEAEWEYACRGGSTTEYYWGDTMDGDYCWYYSNSGNQTHDVGTRQPNAWGLYDMSGNVWEWCNDWYKSTYYNESPSQDPTGPSTGSYRVFRGGGWDGSAGYCRSADRADGIPSYSSGGLGFRPARR